MIVHQVVRLSDSDRRLVLCAYMHMLFALANAFVLFVFTAVAVAAVAFAAVVSFVALAGAAAAAAAVVVVVLAVVTNHDATEVQSRLHSSNMIRPRQEDRKWCCAAGVRRVAEDSGVDVVTMADMLVAGLQPEASAPGLPVAAKSADPPPCCPAL